ncbi:MAG TPA: OB-fold domain-containing protein, partial [Acetobacteraceae bacterium]|nr:OB-fold domain-containing protein [Acetobacteraceae bacterium]
ACGHVQYPPRACCESCLSDSIVAETTESAAGTLLARTVLHHSQEPAFRPQLPLGLGLVQLDAGPIVLCFMPEPCTIGTHVELIGTAAAAGLTARVIRG